MSNWRRRHPDSFPKPVDQEGREFFHADEVARWLDRRTISRAALLPGEIEGGTYGDRFRAAEPIAVAARAGKGPAASWARILRQSVFKELRGDPDVLLELLVLRLRNITTWTAFFGSDRNPVGALDDFLRSKKLKTYPSIPAANRAHQISALWSALDVLTPPTDDDGWSALVDEFLEASAEWLGQGREHYTPRSIVQVMLRITSSGHGKTVCDPCCGSGAILAGAAGAVDGPVRGHALWDSSARIATMALALKGKAATVTADAAPSPEGTLDQYDVVMTNPPFNLRLGDQSWNGRFGHIPARSVNFAWLCDAYERLAPGGRAAVITANGSAFSVGKERNLRAAMVDAGIVERIIALPPRLFVNTAIPVTVWVLRRSETRSVLMVDGRHLGYMADRSHRRLSAEDIGILTSPEPGVHARRVSLREIQEQDYDLSPSRYIPSPDAGEEGAADEGGTLVERVRALAEAERAVQRADELVRARLRGIFEWKL